MTNLFHIKIIPTNIGLKLQLLVITQLNLEKKLIQMILKKFGTEIKKKRS